jgi:outer membrane protein OmpA-like peptidoglycan-associated protein
LPTTPAFCRRGAGAEAGFVVRIKCSDAPRQIEYTDARIVQQPRAVVLAPTIGIEGGAAVNGWVSRMVLRGLRRPAGGRGRTWAAALALYAGLGACNPIDSYRHLVGNDKNDPDPKATANTQNLAAGEAQDYPNLATVPSPPVRAMSDAERKKLTESLVADRGNANYTSERLQPGFSSANTAPPPPPPPPPPAGGEALAAPAPAPPPAVPPPPTATETAASTAPAQAPPPSAASPPPPSAKAAAVGPATVPFSGAAATVPTSPPATTTASATPASGSGPPPSGRRAQSEPPEPGPMESSLQTPAVGSTPLPGQPQTAPAPAPVSWASPPPPRTPPPAAMASANPQPVPALPTPAAPLPPSPPQGKPAVPFLSTTIATLDFPGGSTSLAVADRQTILRAAAQFKQNPGTVRVIAYAAATAAGAGQAQLAAFQTALDRAQAVAAALAQAGVPANKVQTQAAPAEAAAPPGRVEIRLLR